MDVTNRTAAVIASLLLIFVAFLVILLAWQAPDESIKRIADFSGFLRDHNTDAAKLLVTFGGLIFMLLGMIVIIFELAPPQTGSVKVAKVGSGDARIGTDQISQRLEDELRGIAHLRDIEAKVSSRGNRADVKLELYVDTGADLAQTTNEACGRAREIVEGRMGVELEAAPRAEIHYREQHDGRERSVQPREAAPAPTNTPSWRPAEPAPAASSDQPASTSGSLHEASQTAHEDQPTGA